MLVLSRKVGERIQIGDSITITVVDSGNGRVRIGIDAPREVQIQREELLDKVREDAPWIVSRGPCALSS